MKNFSFKLIACIDSENGIGLKNSIPWHEPEDLKIFKSLTLNENVVMGSNTYLSIINSLKKPLPKRTNIVLTNKNLRTFPNVHLVRSIDELISKYKIAWIIGGSNIYKQFLPLCDKLYITVLKKSYNCDKFFPLIPEYFKISTLEHHETFDLVIFNNQKPKSE